jgi:hypothetical protein
VLLAFPASGGLARAAKPKCPPGHSQLIAADAQAQVYHATFGEIFGCASATKKLYLLGAVSSCGSSGCVEVEHETLVGSIVAYGRLSVAPYEHEWRVIVRDLRTGRVLHSVPTGTPVGASPSEGSLVGIGPAVAIVVKSDGAVAWIAENEIGPPRGPLEYQVHIIDKMGERTVAASSNIDASSLALAGSTLYWTQGGQPMSSTLN